MTIPFLKFSLFKLLLLLCIIVTSMPFSAIGQASLPDSTTALYLADPTIFHHKGIYYLYGTVEGNAGEGFLVYTSKDAKTWQGPTSALRKGDAYGTANFWAPQVFYFNHKFYMAYAANENIAIAESDGPLGPFTQKNLKPLDAPVKQIDPFVFIDKDGKKYLYHVRLQEGNRIFVAALKDDFSGIKPETLKECINASDTLWENTANSRWPVAEGPSVIRHKNLYYLTYSANDFRNPDYAVGYAVGTTPYGPWRKFEGNPILSKKDLGINGIGHGDFVNGYRKGLLYVFHTHHSNTRVGPRRTAIIKARFVQGATKGSTGSRNGKTQDKLFMNTGTFSYPEINN